MNDERIPDGRLLRRFSEGDQAAFAEIRRRHGRLVLATCRRETRDAALAEDAAQGVFLLLSQRRFGEDASVAGWLHSASLLVSKNLVRGEIRRRRRERRSVEELTEPERAWNTISLEVDSAISSLKDSDREAILLRFAGGLSLAEVGVAMGIGENAARMRVERALERMRERLRRVGVGVGGILLASLLSTRLADASLPTVGVPSARAESAAKLNPFWRLSLLVGRRSWIWFGSALLIFMAAVVGWSLAKPRRANLTEMEAAFAQATGTWTGRLEYGDDRTDRRTLTDVKVRIAEEGGSLVLISTYPNYRNVDTTRFSPQPDGTVMIDNGGEGASHRLDGVYEPFREGRAIVFKGVSLALRAEVRLRMETSQNGLFLKEEYRRGDDEAYRFRNQFQLRR